MQQSSESPDVAPPLPDMNLLPALDALLRTGSVAGAAAELNVSPSAMSRTLGQLRRVVGDPLLVPSGRGLTLTPRAHEMQPRVQAALAAAVAALRPPREVELATLRREFRIRTNDGVAMSLGAPLLALAAREAPGYGCGCCRRATRTRRTCAPMSTWTWASCRIRCRTTCAAARCTSTAMWPSRGPTPSSRAGR